MESKYYLKKTFVFVFFFYIIFKIVGIAFEKFEGFNLEYIIKTLFAATITALILGGINYFAKVDFLKQKNNTYSQDN